jgi:hypothetical protein
MRLSARAFEPAHAARSASVRSGFDRGPLAGDEVERDAHARGGAAADPANRRVHPDAAHGLQRDGGGQIGVQI